MGQIKDTIKQIMAERGINIEFLGSKPRVIQSAAQAKYADTRMVERDYVNGVHDARLQTYTFVALDYDGKNLGSVEINNGSLPTHLDICFTILRCYPEAKQFTMMMDNGELMDMKTDIDISRYLPHEFLWLFEALNYDWIGKHIQFTDGDLKGEKAAILAYHQGTDGCYFRVNLRNGVPYRLGISDGNKITVID